jgi:DNA-binding winged helix-turn-helix (wHTH) protein/tetratricopeptide (TPR) repeat protein
LIARSSKLFYDFDRYRIDVEERRLLREGESVPLTPKVFDILVELVENNHRTVEKEQLMETVWGDVSVEEGNLSRNVSTLRKVLGEGRHHPPYIKTVPKRGYRFDADIIEVIEDKAPSIPVRLVNQDSALKAGGGGSRRLIPIVGPLIGSALVLLLLGSAWLAFRPPAVIADPAASALTSRGRPRGSTNDPEALALYERARELWRNRSVEGLHQATLSFEQAVVKDPGFALAHAALADAYAFDTGRWKDAEAVANEAVRLDPSLGRPFATIGFVRMFWEGKVREAEPYFKQAIALEPDYATAHQWYGINLTARRLGGSGLAEMKRALEIEPDSIAINADLCQMLYFSRKYEEATEQCRKTLGMDANFLPAHEYLYQIYTVQELYPAAVNEYLTIERLNTTTRALPRDLEKIQQAYSKGGIRAFWRARIEFLKRQHPPFTYPIARYYALLGEHTAALFWLRQSAKVPYFDFIFCAADPAYYTLLSDPSTHDLTARLVDP